jgi:Leucine-rich repeat (LRR) protein
MHAHQINAVTCNLSDRVWRLPHAQDLPGRVLAGLVSLQELELSSNQLRSSLPPELGNLGRLRLLWLRDNQLTELPPSIAGCTSLIELHAGGNATQAVLPSVCMQQHWVSKDSQGLSLRSRALFS